MSNNGHLQREKLGLFLLLAKFLLEINRLNFGGE